MAFISKAENLYPEAQFREFVLTSNTSIADDANESFTLPGMAGVPAVPVVIGPVTPASGTKEGAQVWTPLPSEGDAGVGIKPVSYTEATGVLVVKNTTGGALVKKLIYVKMMLLAPVIPTGS